MFSGPHDTFPAPPYPFHGEIFNHFLDKRTWYISCMINLRGTPAYGNTVLSLRNFIKKYSRQSCTGFEDAGYVTGPLVPLDSLG